jgi:hypothetical protein
MQDYVSVVAFTGKHELVLRAAVSAGGGTPHPEIAQRPC